MPLLARVPIVAWVGVTATGSATTTGRTRNEDSILSQSVSAWASVRLESTVVPDSLWPVLSSNDI